MFAKVKYLLAIGLLFLIPACAPSDNVDLSKSYLSSSSPSEELCDIFIGIRNTTAESSRESRHYRGLGKKNSLDRENIAGCTSRL